MSITILAKGPQGCGKTLALKDLEEYLKQKGFEFVSKTEGPPQHEWLTLKIDDNKNPFL